jgi:hypothetical protein
MTAGDLVRRELEHCANRIKPPQLGQGRAFMLFPDLEARP